MKNEVLMKSSHKLKNERSKYIQAIEQPLISIDLKFFINQMKLRYLKSILQSRSSLLPSYCIRREGKKKKEKDIQYDGSKNNLDWRIDFRYLNFIWLIKNLGSMLIEGCSIEWIYVLLWNFNLWLDFIRTSFFKVLTYLIRLGRKFYII